MIEICRLCLKLFNKDWVSEASGRIVFAERSLTGKGKVVFKVDTSCIVIKPPKQRTIWALAQQKCADGAFLSFCDGEAKLHIIELKSKVTLGTWAHVLEQFEGMFLTSLAVARLLQIQKPAHVICYLVGKEDCITNELNSATPTLLKAPVGSARTFGGQESWNKGVVPLPLAFQATLVKGWRGTTGVAHFDI
jgi:hypothetical protein